MIGEKLGKFTILEIVGSGSMGTVYKAEDPKGRPVAVKLIQPGILYNMEKREHFLQCALVASETLHRKICPIIEIGDDNDEFYIITPFINGRPLDRYMGKKPLPAARALEIAMEIGDALTALHAAGAAHRGLKPSNIWILNNRIPSVLLSDCCIARFTDIAFHGKIRDLNSEVEFADTLIPLDTLVYMSPEQIRGDPVDCRTDVFSFGVVLYEMFCGRHPFENNDRLSSISAILDSEHLSPTTPVPVGLEPVLDKALSKNPGMRYQTAGDMLAAIRAVHDKASSLSRKKRSFGVRKWLAAKFARVLPCPGFSAEPQKRSSGNPESRAEILDRLP